jgi:hypothetical protein
MLFTIIFFTLHQGKQGLLKRQGTSSVDGVKFRKIRQARPDPAEGRHPIFPIQKKTRRTLSCGFAKSIDPLETKPSADGGG